MHHKKKPANRLFFIPLLASSLAEDDAV